MYECTLYDRLGKKTTIITDKPEGVFLRLARFRTKQGTKPAQICLPQPEGVYSLIRL
jgi:hypothetical protein